MSEATNGQLHAQTSKRVVCVRCARIKQACSGGTPCLRCKRLEVACEPNLKTGHDHSKGIAAGHSTAKITRTHTGCVACRRRKKKCDEQRPKCFDCRRLCLDCKYTSPPPKRKLSRSSVSDSHSSPEARVLMDDSSRSSETTATDINIDFLGQMDDANSWEDLMCVSLASTDSCAEVSNLENQCVPCASPGLPAAALSATPDLSTEEDRSLLNHYINVVARILSRRDDHSSNPYLSNIIPLAFSAPVVMEAVLTLSAKHWKKLQPKLWNRGILHQTNTLQALAKLLHSNQSSPMDEILCATLLLCMIELFDGTSSHWQVHLDGARRLLFAVDQRDQWQHKTDFMKFYRKLYHYLDSATTISTCRPPLLEASDSLENKLFENEFPTLQRSDDDETALYGIPRSLFHFLDRINSLAYQRKFRADSIFENVFLASAAKLGKDLEDWVSDHRLEERAADGSVSIQEYAALQATIAYEHALELRLHQVVHGYSQHHDKVERCVKRILEAVQAIRYGSPLESSLIFPLVLAGSSCTTENQRSIIQDRFLIMERTVGFQCVYTAHDLVKRVWEERDQAQDDSPDINWAAIRYFQIPGLAFV